MTNPPQPLEACNSQLLPCPWCAGKAEIRGGPFGEHQARCINPHCGAGLASDCWQTDNEMAAQAWNTRAESAPLRGALVKCRKLADNAAKAMPARGVAEPLMLLEELIETAEAALATAPEAPGWQPIETAPKWQEIIGYRPDQGVFVFRWESIDNLVEEPDEDHEGWWHDVWGWMDGDLAPTQWQPLPEGPALAAQPTAGGVESNKQEVK